MTQLDVAEAIAVLQARVIQIGLSSKRLELLEHRWIGSTDRVPWRQPRRSRPARLGSMFWRRNKTGCTT